METGSSLDELRAHGRMTWLAAAHAWMAEPDEVVRALASDGYEECKREVARGRRGRSVAGGVWQGLNRTTGTVASAIWAKRADTPRPVMFIYLDSDPLDG
jgi:hypothetical protein